MNKPTNVTVPNIFIPLIYLLGVKPSVLIDVTDILALDPFIVSYMGGALVSFPKGDP